MKIGTELTLDITSIAYGGDGIARHEGRVVFVPFTIPDESVRVRIVKVQRDWAKAILLEVLTVSPDRVTAPCRWFMRCGGCAYQHIAYPRQLEIKAQQVRETLSRIGKIESPNVAPVRPSPLQYEYRNRITVHIDQDAVGFRGVDPRRLIDISQCLLAESRVNAALQRLRSKRRLIPGTATLRNGSGGEGFRQVNDGAAVILAELVAEAAGSGGVLVDAYCGSGFFAKNLRENFSNVIGIDWSVAAIDAARSDAREGEEYFAGDTTDLLPEALQNPDETTVILDPPAQGVAPEVLHTLLAARPSRIIYISCDPGTLARDAKALTQAFRLVQTSPVDMFPQTASIETVNVFV